MDYSAALKDYTKFAFDDGRWSRDVYRRGSGPAVIVIHEMPGLHPLAVGNTVMMRTPERMVAVDFKTGKRVWEFPWFDAAHEVETTARSARGGSHAHDSIHETTSRSDAARLEIIASTSELNTIWILPLISISRASRAPRQTSPP